MADQIHQQAGDHSIQIGVARDVYIWMASTAPSRPEFKRYLRMLAVVAAPVVGHTETEPPPAPLDLWAEWRRLEESVRQAWDVVQGQGAPWAVVRLNPPTRNSLADALIAGDAQSAYQVVHFGGHGSAEGLAFEDELGRTDFVTTNELVSLFHHRPVRLVVLNACETQAIARRLHEEAGIPAVIATTDSLRDDEARLLTSRLYAWLARGQPAASAFAEALSALRHAYERDELLIPPEHSADPQAYIVERLAVPVLFGDTRLILPPEGERAESPLISLAEPPSSGIELKLTEGFVGRGPELTQIARLLRDRPSSVIALSGLGGIGKSALAAVSVLRGSWRFSAVVVLSARDTPHLSPDALVQPLDGVLEKGGELAKAPTEAGRLDCAIEALNQSPVMLVLDNLEDLSEAATRAWAKFLSRLDPRRGSAALLTLRPAVKHPLTDVAGVAHLPLERLSEADALRLLADGLTARNRWEKVPAATEPTLAQKGHLETLARRAHLTWLPVGLLASLDELAEKAGRHPLTLRLALGDLKYVDWAKALANVSNLSGRDWEAQAEVMVGRMVDDLIQADPGAVPLLHAMLVFQGGAPYDALRAVAAPDVEQTIFDDLLRAALDASLLETLQTNRYDLHPLTHAYFNRKRPPSPETLNEFRHRHAAYFRKWAREHKPNFDALEAELPNLRVGFAFVIADATRDEEMVRDFGGALNNMFQTRGYWNDLLAWLFEAARACERLGDQENLASTYTNIAGVCWDQGHYRQALDWLQKTATIDEARGDKAGLGNTYNAIGVIYGDVGEMKLSLDWLHKAMALLEEAGDRKGLAITWVNIGGIYYARSDYDTALSYLTKAAPVLEEIGDRQMLAGVYNNIGGIYHARSDYDTALSYLTKAAPVLDEIGDRASLATVYNNIGEIYRARSDYDKALSYYNKAAPVLEEIGDRQTLATVYNNIGAIYRARSDYDTALSYFTKAAPVLEEIGDRQMLATVYNNIGEIYRARSDYDTALSYFTKAAPVLEEIGDRQTLATVYNNIGAIHRARSDYEAALSYHTKAAQLFEEIGDRKSLATTRRAISEVESEKEESTATKNSNLKIPPTHLKGLHENQSIFAGCLTLVGGFMRLLIKKEKTLKTEMVETLKKPQSEVTTESGNRPSPPPKPSYSAWIAKPKSGSSDKDPDSKE